MKLRLEFVEAASFAFMGIFLQWMSPLFACILVGSAADEYGPPNLKYCFCYACMQIRQDLFTLCLFHLHCTLHLHKNDHKKYQPMTPTPCHNIHLCPRRMN